MTGVARDADGANKVHVALAAGGVRVVSYVGAIRHLEQQGTKIASISAISAGSMLGALLCSGLASDELEDWVLTHNLFDYAGKPGLAGRVRTSVSLLLGRGLSTYPGSEFPRLFRELANGDPTFADLAVPFRTVALDVVSHRFVTLSADSYPDMRLSEAIRIATAVPPFYPPVVHEESLLVDASISTNNPLWLAAASVDDLPIVLVRPKRDLTATVDELTSLKPTSYFPAVLAAGIDSSDHLVLDWITERSPQVHVIDVDCAEIPWDKFELEPGDARTLIDRGTMAASAALDAVDGDFRRPSVASPTEHDRLATPGQRVSAVGRERMLTSIPAGLPRSKAFVSSTMEDLRQHRTEVISALRRAGVHVDSMEDWSADTREPKNLSTERLEGCDLCVLLVGFRRGYVPDGETRSITQLEYQEALDRDLTVLVYMLDEDAPWPRGFDELDTDPEIRAWREHLSGKHTVEFFGLEPESVKVLPAVMRWLWQRYEQELERARQT